MTAIEAARARAAAMMREAITAAIRPGTILACPRFRARDGITITYEADFNMARGVHGGWYIQPKGQPAYHAFVDDVIELIAATITARAKK